MNKLLKASSNNNEILGEDLKIFLTFISSGEMRPARAAPSSSS